MLSALTNEFSLPTEALLGKQETCLVNRIMSTSLAKQEADLAKNLRFKESSS